MKHEIIESPAAPEAIGPYSQAVRIGGLLYTAGQVPLDPATMKLVPGGIAEQTRRVLENLRAVLAAAGAGFEDVVKTTVFLQDLSDFAAFNEVYGEVFAGSLPARSTVQVAALPLGARVEIELVAALED
ncbi:MAG: RidA family protein [Candidatus Krumholzibacteriota bacterium]|nr:RidA family protein [Candidatus Krumholzibacteriota bacterium]